MHGCPPHPRLTVMQSANSAARIDGATRRSRRSSGRLTAVTLPEPPSATRLRVGAVIEVDGVKAAGSADCSELNETKPQVFLVARPSLDLDGMRGYLQTVG